MYSYVVKQRRFCPNRPERTTLLLLLLHVLPLIHSTALIGLYLNINFSRSKPRGESQSTLSAADLRSSYNTFAFTCWYA